MTGEERLRVTPAPVDFPPARRPGYRSRFDMMGIPSMKIPDEDTCRWPIRDDLDEFKPGSKGGLYETDVGRSDS